MIVVHSKGRHDVRKGTIDTFFQAGTDWFTIVAPDNEVRLYEERWPGVAVVGKTCKTLPQVQQWIFSNLCSHTTHFTMVDDDLLFSTRVQGTTKFTRSAPHDVRSAVERVGAAAEEHGHATMAPRQGANHLPHGWKTVGPARSVLSFDTATLRRHSLRFDHCDSKSDYDMTLSLLRLGYQNAILCDVVHDQSGGPTLAGGCTDYRDIDYHRRASEQLENRHTLFVDCVEKSKPDWEFPRVDVRVAWKKAYLAGVDKHGAQKPPLH